MTRTSRIVVAMATLAGCLLLGVLIGALGAWGGEADGDAPAASRPATPASTPATTTTAVATASTEASTTTTASPTTAAPTTTAAPGPVADFGWSPETPRRGDSIRLVDRSSGGPVSYTWRWSGSVIHGSRAGNIAFSVQRDTDVTLTVCDQAGRCAEATKTIVVS